MSLNRIYLYAILSMYYKINTGKKEGTYYGY